MTNIIHDASRIAIDWASQDIRGAAAVFAVGAIGLIAGWAWNKRKERNETNSKDNL